MYNKLNFWKDGHCKLPQLLPNALTSRIIEQIKNNSRDQTLASVNRDELPAYAVSIDALSVT